VAKIKDERERLTKELAKFEWIKPIPSHSNFILNKIEGRSAPELALRLRQLGVLIRYYPFDTIKDYIRISIGRPQDSDKLLWALRLIGNSKLEKSLNGFAQGILFDMDGVLADVSQSYRQAIMDTCKSFGVTVTMTDIDYKKAQSGFNNDWVLTHSLLQDNGVQVTYDECKDKFEEIYQGTASNPGLWQRERLIPRRSLLKFLRSKFPMAVVTGRPRHDALQFLKQHDISEFFDHLVCDEDTEKHKPDPEPVIKALQLLNVQKAILIGDTPDDIRAAVGVPERFGKVIGLGILAPNKAADAKMKESLHSAGAACVLQDLQELRLMFDQ